MLNGWNKRIEYTTKMLGIKSGAYRIMHDEASTYYYRLNKIISICSISLVTLTATGSFTTITIEDDIIIKIITGIVLYVIAFITSLKEFFNYTQLSERHKLYSIRFSALYHNIQRQMSLNEEDRQDGKDYIGWINNEFDSLFFSNPEIPQNIKEKVLKKYGNKMDNEIILCNSSDEDSKSIDSNESKSIDGNDSVIVNINNENKKLTEKTKYEVDRYMAYN